MEHVARLTHLYPELPVPNVIVAGTQTTGKSSLFQAIIGLPFNFSKPGIATRCALQLVTICSAGHDGPEWEVQGRPEIKHTPDVQRYLQEVNEELERRGEVGEHPLCLTLRWARCPNLVLLDLPGLQSFAGSPELERVRAQILELNRKVIRERRKDGRQAILVVLEAAGQDPATFAGVQQVIDIVHDENTKGKGSEGVTMVFVASKLDKTANVDQLRQGLMILQNQKKSSVGGRGIDPLWSACFAVSAPVVDKGAQPSVEEFLDARQACQTRDIEVVGQEHLQDLLDPDARVGVEALVKFLVKTLVDKLREMWPRIHSDLQSQIAAHLKEANELESGAIKSWADTHLHLLATHFANSVLRIWQGHMLPEEYSFLPPKTLQEEYEDLRGVEHSEFSYRSRLTSSGEIKTKVERLLGAGDKEVGGGSVNRFAREFVMSMYMTGRSPSTTFVNFLTTRVRAAMRGNIAAFAAAGGATWVQMGSFIILEMAKDILNKEFQALEFRLISIMDAWTRAAFASAKQQIEGGIAVPLILQEKLIHAWASRVEDAVRKTCSMLQLYLLDTISSAAMLDTSQFEVGQSWQGRLAVIEQVFRPQAQVGATYDAKQLPSTEENITNFIADCHVVMLSRMPKGAEVFRNVFHINFTNEIIQPMHAWCTMWAQETIRALEDPGKVEELRGLAHAKELELSQLQEAFAGLVEE